MLGYKVNLMVKIIKLRNEVIDGDYFDGRNS